VTCMRGELTAKKNVGTAPSSKSERPHAHRCPTHSVVRMTSACVGRTPPQLGFLKSTYLTWFRQSIRNVPASAVNQYLVGYFPSAAIKDAMRIHIGMLSCCRQLSQLKHKRRGDI
jgi:hypothetical protein